MKKNIIPKTMIISLLKISKLEKSSLETDSRKRITEKRSLLLQFLQIYSLLICKKFRIQLINRKIHF